MVRVKEIWRISSNRRLQDMTLGKVQSLMEPFVEAGIKVDMSVEESKRDSNMMWVQLDEEYYNESARHAM